MEVESNKSLVILVQCCKVGWQQTVFKTGRQSGKHHRLPQNPPHTNINKKEIMGIYYCCCCCCCYCYCYQFQPMASPVAFILNDKIGGLVYIRSLTSVWGCEFINFRKFIPNFPEISGTLLNNFFSHYAF